MPKLHGGKAGAKSTPSKVIRYVLNEKKTLAYDTIGLADDQPYSQQFREVARLQDSEYGYDERKYYHFKMTFEEKDWDKNGGKITTDKALEMGKKFCEENFSGHDAVLSVHGDTSNLHVHIVLNAFSSEYGKNKIHLNEKQYAGLKDWAYEKGKEYDLTEKNWRVETIEKRERKRRERGNQQSTEPINLSIGENLIVNSLDKKDRIKDFADYSWKEQYRIAIDEAKGATTSIDSFCAYLKEHFHIDTQITKYGNIKYKSPGRMTCSSGKALGSNYELEAVERALEETKRKPSDLPKEPTKEELRVADWQQKFDEEYEKFRKWSDEEYIKQRGDWLKKEREADADAEYFRDKTVLENTDAYYRLCREAVSDETLSTMLSDKQRDEMEALEQSRERLLRAEKEDERIEAIGRNQKDFWEFRDEMKRKYSAAIDDSYDDRRDIRGKYYDAMRVLRNTDNILVMVVAAGTALYSLRKEQKINEQIQELKEQRMVFAQNTASYETFQRAYGAELQGGKLPGTEYMDNVANTYRMFDREQKRQQYIHTLQTTGTSIADRMAAAQGIQKMNIEDNQKSRENELYKMYGRDTRTIRVRKDWKVQAMYDSVRVARELGANNSAELEVKVKQEGREYGKIKREYTEAKKQCEKNIKSATDELAKDDSLSVEERIRRTEQITAAEYEKLKPIKEKFHEAKEHYKMCARALDTVNANNAANAIYTSPVQPEEVKKEETPRQTKETSEQTQEVPSGQKKEKAIKLKNQQLSELRDWSDDAVKVVAERAGRNNAANLKEWASEMEKHGCTVRITASTISVKHPDSKQPVRTNQLGRDYEKEAIENAIVVRSKERSRAEQTTVRTAEQPTRAEQSSERNSGAPQRNSRTQGLGRELVKERNKGLER